MSRPAARPSSTSLDAFSVFNEADYPAGENPELDAALTRLSTALRACPNPVHATVKSLTVDEIGTALNALTPRQRTWVLGPLGIRVKPRTIGQHLCRDVLGRLVRADAEVARGVAHHLTHPAVLDIIMSAFASEAPAGAVIHDPATRWSPTLAQLAQWSTGHASVHDGRIWKWAAAQDWFVPEGTTPEQVAEIVAAAEAVIAATPDFQFLQSHTCDDHAEDQVEAAPADGEQGTPPAEPADAATAATEPTESAADDDAPTATADAAPAAPVVDADDSPALVDAVVLTAAEDALAAAVDAARTTLVDLEAQRPPSVESLAALTLARATFEAAVAHLPTGTATPTDLPALRQAIDDAQHQAADRPLRQALAALDTLVADAGADLVAAQLAQAQERARALAALTPWSEQDRLQASALALLADLSAGHAPAADVLAMQQTFATALPNLALLALSATTLRRTAPEAAGPADNSSQSVDPSQEVADDDPEPDREPTPTSAPAPSEPATEAATRKWQPALAPAPAAAPAAEPATSRPRRSPAPAAAAPEVVVTADPAPSTDPKPDGQARAAAADLIARGRFALAAELDRASGAPSPAQAVLPLASLAAAVRTQTSPIAAALRTTLNDLDPSTWRDDTTSLLLAAPALLRAALVTGEPAAGALMLDLSAHLEPHLAAIAEQVGSRAIQGVLLDAPPLTILSDVADLERSLTRITAAATALLRPRTLRFKRASDIAKTWLEPGGFLGTALRIVADDDRSRLDEVKSALTVLSDPAHIAREIDEQDRAARTNNSKPIQGAGRGDLITLAAEAITPLTEWVETLASLARSDRSAQWSTTEIADMRAAVLTHADAAVAALTAQAGHTDPLSAAAATAAAASLRDTIALLHGEQVLTAREPSAAAALGLELLLISGAQVDPSTGQVTLPDPVTQAELLAAANRGWDEAVRTQVEAENFPAAVHLVQAGEAGMLATDSGAVHTLAADVVEIVNSAENVSRVELERTHAELASALRTARLNNQVSEEQDTELASLLAAADTGERDLAHVRAILDQIAERLPHYRQEAETRLQDRLTRAVEQGRVTDADTARVSDLIAAGDLATAEELIYNLEIGERVPQVHTRDDLPAFFPAVPNALPRGITAELVTVARERGALADCPVLDFSALSPDLASLTADALAKWARLAHTPPEHRRNASEPELLLPALRVAGIEGKKIEKRHELPLGRDRRFVDVVDVTINGKAMVPAFGSKLNRRLRVLLVWGQPSADMLMSLADQDPSGGALLVAYFGTMSAQVRADLAVRATQTNAPVVVLDDAALSYLAARGARQMDATMTVLLPFASVNPYIRQKRGLVAAEMFYGRDTERHTVLDPDGTQILYGGRGLGKSALLRDACTTFEDSSVAADRIAIYLSLDTIGIGGGPALGPAALWDALLAALTDREVIAPTKSSRRDAHEQVRSGVNAWLAADRSRRLFIALDECDRFFEADAPQFLETSKLRQLGVVTDGAVKVVFAGLHSVQRYAKVAGNGPFSHLAQRPTVIGPLAPQYASNLLTAPMGTMGYTFAEPDLVNRVLGYCSYQPFLLQMFGNRLVERMHQRRRAGAAAGVSLPPYVVCREDIEAVESNTELREDISTAFHDTLHLDPRYSVIANVLAHHAHEFSMDARLTDIELREECMDWWRDGFANLDVEAFRAYLHEMVGLGVLAPNSDGRGWHLRGPNVLRMIGNQTDVMTQLVGAQYLAVPDAFVALETRPERDGLRSPLTVAQLDDVLGDHTNQVRVVLGSRATGIGDAAAAIRSAADVGNRFTVPHISSKQSFGEELEGGKPGDRRVVLSDLAAASASDSACEVALETALTRRPIRSGVTRSAVLVVSTEQTAFWRQVLGADDAGSLGVVALRRYDHKTLRVWAMDAQQFRLEDRFERLLEVTGGWPVLVQRAAAAVSAGTDESAALGTLAQRLATPAGAAELVDMVGVCADADLAAAYADLVELLSQEEKSSSLVDLHAAVSDRCTDPVTTIACLQALGVFLTDEDGRFHLEPVLAAAWSNRG